MAHLGRGEYDLLVHLSEHGTQPVQAEGNRATVGTLTTRTAVIDNLVNSGLAARAGEGATQVELTEAGRAELDKALMQKWVVDHSGLHEESGTYRFEVPDPVTGRRFVVAVQEQAGPQVAHRAAYSVIGAQSVREHCRALQGIGQDQGFSVETALEGAGEIAIWRKL